MASTTVRSPVYRDTDRSPFPAGSGASTASECRYRASCQRCASGNLDHEGIPAPRLPLVRNQCNSPSLTRLTRSVRRLGRFPIPRASSPWQEAQLLRNKMPPALAASALSLNGLALTRSFSGTFASQSRLDEAIANEVTNKKPAISIGNRTSGLPAGSP